MKIHMLIFISAMNEEHTGVMMLKTVESDIRPAQGDILDDPGFHPQFHNGYEVVKVTLNYTTHECWLSLSPLALELQEIKLEAYKEHLESHGWREVTREELAQS